MVKMKCLCRAPSKGRLAGCCRREIWAQPKQTFWVFKRRHKSIFLSKISQLIYGSNWILISNNNIDNKSSHQMCQQVTGLWLHCYTIHLTKDWLILLLLILTLSTSVSLHFLFSILKTFIFLMFGHPTVFNNSIG